MRVAFSLPVVGILACGAPANQATQPGQSSSEMSAVAESSPATVRGLKKVTDVGTGDARLDMAFQVRGHFAKEARYLKPGDAMSTGNRVELFVRLEQRAYVYIVQFFADGTSAVLFPDEGDRQLRGKTRHRIPEAGSWFELDDATGEEHIYVVASRRRLERVAAAIAKEVEKVRVSQREGNADTEIEEGDPDPDADVSVASGSPSERADSGGTPAVKRPKKKKKKKRKLLTLANRGSSTLVRSAGEPAILGRGDRDGVLVFHFWFRHK